MKRSTSVLYLFEGHAPYLNFINTIKSARSVKTYSRCLEGYIKYRKVERAEGGGEGRTLEHLLTENPKAIEASIMSYLMSMRTDYDLSFAARSTILAAIKHFYRMNDVELNWHKVAKVLGEHSRRVLNKRPYSREEIHKMLASADQRMRVVILLLTSSGMIASLYPQLYFKHLLLSCPIEHHGNSLPLNQTSLLLLILLACILR